MTDSNSTVNNNERANQLAGQICTLAASLGDLCDGALDARLAVASTWKRDIFPSEDVERLHPVSSNSGRPRSKPVDADGDLNKNSKRTHLLTIGMLASALADARGNALKQGDRVSANAITQDLLGRWELDGCSESALQKRISEALTVLGSETP